MKLSEVDMNIMCAPQGYYLVHAISRDLNFKVGLPALFDRTFDLKTKILNHADLSGVEPNIGEAFLVDNVFSLVVKDSSYDMPDRDELMNALIDMRDSMETLCIRKFAMPKICCGRGGLDWDDVRNMIEFVFNDYDCQILVCVQ